jgi:hypothetical protein
VKALFTPGSCEYFMAAVIGWRVGLHEDEIAASQSITIENSCGTAIGHDERLREEKEARHHDYW